MRLIGFAPRLTGRDVSTRLRAAIAAFICAAGLAGTVIAAPAKPAPALPVPQLKPIVVGLAVRPELKLAVAYIERAGEQVAERTMSYWDDLQHYFVPPALRDQEAARKAKLAAAQDPERTCLAQAVYYEARGETREGQIAIAEVVIRRTVDGRYPRTICGVVFDGANRRGCQFSFACNGDMKRPRTARPGSGPRRSPITS